MPSPSVAPRVAPRRLQPGAGLQPVVRRSTRLLVLVGGGHAHVAVLKLFGVHPMPNVDLTLVTRSLETPYSGMLPGYCSGQYTHEELHVDLVELAQFANARIIHAEAVAINATEKTLTIQATHTSLSQTHAPC